MGLVKAIFYSLVLIAKAPIVLIDFYQDRNEGVKSFRRELLQMGIHPLVAEELTVIYKNMLFPGWKELFQQVKGMVNSK